MCFAGSGGEFLIIFKWLWWYYDPMQKFEIFKKCDFYEFFGFFDAGRFGRKKAQKCIKSENFQRNDLWTPKMFPDT